MLVVRGSALLRFKNQRRTISLSGGDLFIFILSDEPFTLMDHPRSTVVDSSELRKLEVDGVIHYGGGGPAHDFGGWVVWHECIRGPNNFHYSASFSAPAPEQDRSHAFQSVLDLLAAETAQPGIASSRLIGCLYESLFVYAIRAYASSSALAKGVLAAISTSTSAKP